MKDNHFKFSSSVITLPFLFVLSLWIVFWAAINFHFNIENYGIFPRTFSGLRGVILSPFIHGSVEHLYNNSIPLLILLSALRYFYREQSMQILGFGILLSGIITWVIGRDSYHIGASGLVYVLVSFIFFKGIMTKYYRLVALSLVVVMVYGSLVWYIFPHVEEGISWEGHLAGLITGFVFAVIFKAPEYKKMIRYDWEHPDFNPSEDKFLQRFDKNGNFVNLPEPEIIEEVIDSNKTTSTSNYKIVYDYVTKNYTAIQEEDLNEKNELKP
jgi:membrane associated rhomboid family serine protease